MGRSKGLPRAKDVKTFSDGVWVTERAGVSHSRSARTGRFVSRGFGRYAKSAPRTTVTEKSKKDKK